MKFTSTRNTNTAVSFAEALFQGLAPDGGLYQWEKTPNLSAFFASLTKDMTFKALSASLTQRLLGPEIAKESAESIIADAFSFEPALRQIDENTTVLELFHGPSCAFKDFGASFLAAAMNRLLAGRDERAIIVTATSGDTGSAVAQAFHGKKNIDVVILYPSGRVSPLQEKQLTTLGDNVAALEVMGSFDDCQHMAKAAFTNPRLSALPLSSANSINIGRLIPQSFYYVWAWAQLKENGVFTFVVPSGNFGNITAGLYARAWGMPGARFAAATNANRVIPEYLQTGTYSPRASVATLSNAMDVGAPSNYERLNCLYEQNVEIFRQNVESWSVDDTATRETMTQLYRKYGYLACPHTAVGWRVAEIYKQQHPGAHTVVLSTAHPGKFVETVRQATGETPRLPEALAALEDKPKVATIVGNTDNDLENYLVKRFM